MHFLIDVEAFDYSVSTTGSEGIILSILHQLDIPIMKNIGINVQPGQDVQIAVTPSLMTTNKEAKRRFRNMYIHKMHGWWCMGCKHAGARLHRGVHCK